MISMIVPKDKGKQNPNKSYTSKYQKQVASSYDYDYMC